jgi:hypothetical protein
MKCDKVIERSRNFVDNNDFGFRISVIALFKGKIVKFQINAPRSPEALTGKFEHGTLSSVALNKTAGIEGQ